MTHDPVNNSKSVIPRAMSSIPLCASLHRIRCSLYLWLCYAPIDSNISFIDPPVPNYDNCAMQTKPFIKSMRSHILGEKRSPRRLSITPSIKTQPLQFPVQFPWLQLINAAIEMGGLKSQYNSHRESNDAVVRLVEALLVANQPRFLSIAAVFAGIPVGNRSNIVMGSFLCSTSLYNNTARGRVPLATTWISTTSGITNKYASTHI